jgi:hypothetical protein
LIRKAEARYFPYLLRQTLAQSQQWGVVRVMPDDYQSAELLIRGKILRSDGLDLQVAIKVVDSAGRVWIDKNYQARAQTNLETPSMDTEIFASLYRRISDDMLAYRAQLSEVVLNALPVLTKLRYGAEILPEYFSEYLALDELGLAVVKRMPALNDPMLARIERMQAYEYLFVDTADEQYQNTQEDMRKAYNLWRQFSREQILYIEDYQRRSAKKQSDYRRGSFGAMNETYGNYQWFRQQEQNQEELAQGFDNEVTPTVMDLDDRIVTLDGNLQAQYLQWREILRSMLLLERGDP